MQVTVEFKNVLNAQLQTIAAADQLFAETLKKPNKNIDDCCTYILNEVKKSGCNGFAEPEIYAMAVHYYDEDDIEIGKPINARVVVNQTVSAPKKAAAAVKTEKKPAKTTTKEPLVKQASIFG